MLRSGFSAGRLFGIEIYIDWSLLLIFLLVTWSLASLFGQLHAAWGPALRWGTAVLAAILFFLSVLAHELAHSFMARAQGMSVRRITLFLFGGVSNIQRHPPSPMAEFLIAIVGPITSVVLGVLFIVASTASLVTVGQAMADPTEAIGQLGPISTLLLWLGPINIALGVFNMLPGFPLDGGRVLRSVLWGVTDSLRQATRLASWAGQGVAWLMIVSGIAMIFGARLPFLGGGLVNGLWLAFIGWFLNTASQQSYRQVVIQDVLEDVPISRLMRRNVPAVEPAIAIDRLVDDYLMQSDDHSFPVLDGSRLVGLVTLTDVRSVPRPKWSETRVQEIMTPADQLITVSSGEEAITAMNELAERDVRQVPVLENGRLVGMLSRRDFVRWLQLHSESGVDSMVPQSTLPERP